MYTNLVNLDVSDELRPIEVFWEGNLWPRMRHAQWLSVIIINWFAIEKLKENGKMDINSGDLDDWDQADQKYHESKTWYSRQGMATLITGRHTVRESQVRLLLQC
jgi:hypothetical protein